MGCVPVSCACWAIRAEGSTAMEEGRGRREVRFGAVEVRRGSRVGADIVGAVVCVDSGGCGCGLC